MKETVRRKLSEISEEEWDVILKKCYGHIKLKLMGKTSSGAHTSYRLGSDAVDFYMGNAIKAIYTGTWEWKFEQFSMTEQLIRIINSMISEEVRKYKIERDRNDKTISLESLDTETTFTVYDEDPQLDDRDFLAEIIDKACSGNESFEKLVALKREGKGYKEISEIMGCTVSELYRYMEKIAKKANAILKTTERQEL